MLNAVHVTQSIEAMVRLTRNQRKAIARMQEPPDQRLQPADIDTRPGTTTSDEESPKPRRKLEKPAAKGTTAEFRGLNQDTSSGATEHAFRIFADRTYSPDSAPEYASSLFPSSAPEYVAYEEVPLVQMKQTVGMP